MLRFAAILVTLLLVPPLSAQDPPQSSPAPGHITRAGVARAQAVVDSIFLDRKATEGTIEGGDWASYLMARLGVEPIPENTEIKVGVDSEHVVLSGRLQDFPAEARAMLGPLTALVDSSIVLSADIVMVPEGSGIAHFRLRGVSVGGFPVPEIILAAMLMDVGSHYPALTRTGRDLLVEIPPDGRVTLVPGAIRLAAPAPGKKSPP